MNLARTAELLLAHALSLPNAWEDHPWGERVAKVGTKIFLFFGRDSARGESLKIAVKLPKSSISALDRPECEPTGYGMGKHGWVTAKYEQGDAPSLDLLKSWVDESYRAVAPKKLAKALDGATDAVAKPRAKVAAKRAVKNAVKSAPSRSVKSKPRPATKRKVARTSTKTRAR